MELMKKLFTNCACPAGRLGKLMLKFMNVSHGPLTNWGLDCVSIDNCWTMLDIGCGGGATIQRLLKRSKGGVVYGIDISEESVRKACSLNASLLDKRVFIRQGSAEQLPYDDRQFDLVTAVETIYFWPNLAHCLQEVHRVLKPHGRFAVIVEAVENDSVWTNVVEGMIVYTPEQIKQYLSEAGFTDIQVYRKGASDATIVGIKP
ncbi:MAG: class I SAM-dependent methyltransferase [Paludibacteraceae bacterium]|nr:class I SAM-dependent methyltransferase [Paludibacteraceae bacterium]